ncbi:hypothetical protein [Burkholderia gladioli]|uniref:hypothetical protein n=1 Tax=Burkholderia gladioli TaxID=28095 RepID=UPI00164164C0|nr:hypothetical protein [Burkholderia gladioli]
MDANELKFAQTKLQERTKVSAQICMTIRFIVISIAVVVSIYFIMSALKGQSEGAIAAIAKVVDAMKLGSLLGYGWGAVATVAYGIERSRRKK